MAERKRVKVIYILGYGRSGSTFFDILLNNIAGVTSIGAPSNFFEWLETGQPCGCGAPLAECEFWRDVIADYFAEFKGQTAADLKRIQFKVEGRRRFLGLMRGAIPEAVLHEYGRSQQALYQAAARRSGDDVLVESSKSMGRPYALARYAPELDMRVVHLVRDSRGVSWSAMKGIASPERTRWALPSPLRAGKTALGWTMTNSMCLMAASRMDPARIMTLRYEDLVSEPITQLRRVGEFAEIDVSSLLARIENQGELEVGHNIGGNRVRFNRSIQIKPDLEWPRNMPSAARFIVTGMSWPMLRHFGYPVANGSAGK